VDGEYVAPPYEVQSVDEKVLINGRELKHKIPELRMGGGGTGGPGPGTGFRPGPGGGPPGRGGPGARGGGDGRDGPGWREGPFHAAPSPSERARQHAADLRGQLAGASTVISFADQPLVLIPSGAATYDLMCAMVGELKMTRPVSVGDSLPSDLDLDVWANWLLHFKPTDELRTRAVALISTFDTAEEEAEWAIEANRRLTSLAYPLTVGSMFLSVLAFGHLLGGRPHAGQQAVGVDASPEMLRALNWSLVFIALLSALDLGWTILAAQADQMLELNPIGSHLVEDPRHLIGFKVGAIVPSIGLLWLLRRYKRAQVAAWWACLILTLLALRWSFSNVGLDA
jgi:hypothetical protein